MVFAGWALAFAVIFGLGAWLRAAFGLKGTGGFVQFWLGYVALIALLYGWYLVAPINAVASVSIGAVGLAGCGFYIARLGRFTIHPLRLVCFVIIIGIAATWVANRALDSQLDFDSVFYHLSSIRWRNEFAVVPGLGNLHYRLAFNQSFFLYCAWLNVYPFFGHGYSLANSLLLIVLVMQSTYAALRLVFGPGTKRLNIADLLAAAFIPLALYRAEKQPYSANISGPSPDLGIFILQAAAAFAFARVLWGSAESDKPDPYAMRERRLWIFLAVTLGAVSVTQKLSGAAFAVALVAVVFAIETIRERQALRAAIVRTLLPAFAGAALIGGLWVAVGLIESGYPAFPSRIGAVAVDYRIPAATAKEAEDWVYSWARYPVSSSSAEQVLGNWDWLPTWTSLLALDPMNQFQFVVPFYAALFGLVAVVILLIIRRKLDIRWVLLIIPAVLSCLYWWLSAPDPRFAGASFWLLAIALILAALDLLFGTIKRRWKQTLVRVLPFASIIISALLLANGYATSFDPARVAFPTVANEPVQLYTTASGFQYNIAADPDRNLQMGDPPLPVSPYLIPKLELRGTGIADGFRTRE